MGARIAVPILLLIGLVAAFYLCRRYLGWFQAPADANDAKCPRCHGTLLWPDTVCDTCIRQLERDVVTAAMDFQDAWVAATAHRADRELPVPEWIIQNSQAWLQVDRLRDRLFVYLQALRGSHS